MSDTVILGKRYRDNIHGVEGVAVARYEYLTGCTRIALEFVKEGEIKEHVFDEPQLVRVCVKTEAEPELAKVAPEDRGGPRMGPPSRDPTR